MADWQAIRAEYEQGASLRSLAAKHNVSKTYIIEKRNKEHWTIPTDHRPTTTAQGMPTLPKDANHAFRLAEAIKYRRMGWTYERIAIKCGYGDESQARKAIKHALRQMIIQNVEDWRNDHMARLEALHEEVWELAIDKTNKGRLFAIDRLLLIQERQSKLLGLDMRPDEEIANQPYEKRIVLIDEPQEVKA